MNAKAEEDTSDQESLNQRLRHEAIVGVIPEIKKLIRMGADINSKAAHGETALEYSIRFGRFGAALKLIHLGAAQGDCVRSVAIIPCLSSARASSFVETI